MITQKRIQTGAIAFAVLVILNILCVSAITGSIGNSKMILYPEVNGRTFTTIEKTILVKNVNNVSVNISLEIDEDGKEFLELKDSNFILAPNSEKKAEFLVKVKTEGKYFGKINVFFTPIGTKEPGIVLSSSISVIAGKEGQYSEKNSTEENEEKNIDGDKKSNKGFLFMALSSLVLLIVLILMIFMIYKKKKAKMSENKKVKKKNSDGEKE